MFKLQPPPRLPSNKTVLSNWKRRHHGSMVLESKVSLQLHLTKQNKSQAPVRLSRLSRAVTERRSDCAIPWRKNHGRWWQTEVPAPLGGERPESDPTKCKKPNAKPKATPTSLTLR
ncbi:hypothetical protein VTH82DRAFT_1387 [Thermothelomyces myriococcoides]